MNRKVGALGSLGTGGGKAISGILKNLLGLGENDIWGEKVTAEGFGGDKREWSWILSQGIR